MLPQELQELIQEQLQFVSLKGLREKAKLLTNAYREKQTADLAKKHLGKAYLAYRTPATYAVAEAVFSHFPKASVESLLEIGAGIGALRFLYEEKFSFLKQVVLFERDQEMVELGIELNKRASFPFNQQWEQKIIDEKTRFPTVDLAVFSYSIGEFSEQMQTHLLTQLQESAESILLIEPGTPKSYHNLLKRREHLIRAGWFIHAPCPHEYSCPLKENDWCHFSERVARSKEHRLLKEGTLGFEDEKYFYLIASKTAPNQRKNCILAPPKQDKRGVELKTCTTNESVKKIFFSKKDKEKFSLFKKLRWGDRFL